MKSVSRVENVEIKKRMKAVATAALLACLALHLISQARETQVYYKYLNFPAAIQAECADYKLNNLIVSLQNSQDKKKVQGYKMTQQWLQQAINAFSRFDETIKGYAGQWNPQESPHGMMTHLWRAEEGMKQAYYAFQRSPRSPSTTANQIRSLKKAAQEAISAIEKAVNSAEMARGWQSYTDGMFITFQVPQGFKPGKDANHRLYLFNRGANQKIDKAVFVRVEKLTKTNTLAKHDSEIIAREKKNSANMKVIENRQHFPGLERGWWFTYTYTWGGLNLKGLLYSFSFSNWILEIKYLSVIDKFSMEEAEGIVRSYDLIR
jgi:hypothetical protein